MRSPRASRDSIAIDGHHRGTQRVAGHDCVRQWSSLERHGHALAKRAEQAVREAGSLVLLHHDDRHALQPRRERARARSRTHRARRRRAGRSRRTNRSAAHRRDAQPPQRSDVGERQPSLDAASGQQDERVAGRRDERRLEPALAADQVIVAGAWPRATSAPATASPGITCPAVPPPAMTANVSLIDPVSGWDSPAGRCSGGDPCRPSSSRATSRRRTRTAGARR